MFFWRVISISILIVGLFLLGQSLLTQDITLFYLSIIAYGIASLIWLTIQKLYVNFSMPKNPQNNIRNASGGVADAFDVIYFFDIILGLPKIIFLFLIHAIYN